MIDPGLVNAVTFNFMKDLGKLLENVVYLHLIRNNQPVYFIRNHYECDFVQLDETGIRRAIQVAYSIGSFSSRQREIKSLLKALERLHLDRGLIVTFDEQETLTINGKEIEIIPAWQWLLSPGLI